MWAKIRFFAFLTLNIWNFVAQAAQPQTFDAPKIKNAYRNEKGVLLLRFKDNSKLFPSGNTVFIQRGSKLQQIEITMHSIDEGATDLSFSNGSISLSESEASLFCNDKSSSFKPLSSAELAQVEKDIHTKKLSLSPLPKGEEPVYLLQVKDSDEFVYVSSPQYNFHGNFRVSIIKNGKWKNIETLESPLQESSDLSGLIRFKNGGALYVPGAIDLFLPPAKHRGSPTLVRQRNSKIETLIRPQLNQAQLSKLGIRPIKAAAQAISPCD